MPIPWDKEYSVNVVEIDDQHKYFIGLMNELYDVMLTKNSNKKIQEVFEKLVLYANVHFATEEKYFDQFNYELADEHKREHKKLTIKIEEFKNLYQEKPQDTFEITKDLIDFLENWLVDHLANQDKKYVECFNKNGLL